MAFYTNRNNVKSMLFSISFVVMVFLCIVIAIETMQSLRTDKNAFFDCSCNSLVCLVAVSVLLTIFLTVDFIFSAVTVFLKCFIKSISSTFRIIVYFISFTSSLFAVLGFIPYFSSKFCTILASIAMVIFCRFILIKQVNRFNLFAFDTSFRYDWFSHFFSPIKVMVKAVCGLRPTDGLFYYSTSIGEDK